MEVTKKKVLVFGSGISGIGAAKLLEAQGAKVTLYDGNEKLLVDEVRKKLGKESKAEIFPPRAAPPGGGTGRVR